TFARNYSHDIAAAEIADYPSGPILRLSTHREGLYDQLPYALFHRPEPYYPGQKLQSRLEESEAARARELSARKFFFPFEQEYFLTGVKTELNERRLTDGFYSPLRRRLLLEIWTHCTRVRAEKLPLLSYVLPLSYRIAGDLDLMAVSYRAVLQLPIQMNYRFSDESPPMVEPEGEGLKLGVDLGLGGLLVEELPKLEIRIGPMDKARSAAFLPGGEDYELFQLLNDCMVPYELDVLPVYCFHAGEENLVLAEDTPADSRLGFTSRLPVSA
ncbi:MAG: hypothetical protein AAGA62_04265, partial [Bacteroidota bacterium]